MDYGGFLVPFVNAVGHSFAASVGKEKSYGLWRYRRSVHRAAWLRAPVSPLRPFGRPQSVDSESGQLRTHPWHRRTLRWFYPILSRSSAQAKIPENPRAIASLRSGAWRLGAPDPYDHAAKGGTDPFGLHPDRRNLFDSSSNPIRKDAVLPVTLWKDQSSVGNGQHLRVPESLPLERLSFLNLSPQNTVGTAPRLFIVRRSVLGSCLWTDNSRGAVDSQASRKVGIGIKA